MTHPRGLDCKWCVISGSTGPYSEYTPGDPMCWECANRSVKNVMIFSDDINKKEIAEFFETCEACECFEEEG